MKQTTTLEEFLEEFVEENTNAGDEDLTLAVTDEQIQSLGQFFIRGLAGFIHGLRKERGLMNVPQSETAESNAPEAESCLEESESVN